MGSQLDYYNSACSTSYLSLHYCNMQHYIIAIHFPLPSNHLQPASKSVKCWKEYDCNSHDCTHTHPPVCRLALLAFSPCRVRVTLHFWACVGGPEMAYWSRCQPIATQLLFLHFQHVLFPSVLFCRCIQMLLLC